MYNDYRKDYVFIKTSELGNRELKLGNKLHKYILIDLYNNAKNTIDLSKKLCVSDIELTKELNILEKANLIKNLRGKWITDFIILDTDMTNYLYIELKKYSEYIAPKIIECLQSNKEQILSINFKGNNFKWENLLALFVLIATDVVYKETIEKWNNIYQSNKIYDKKWSITGYANLGYNYIATNNINSNNMKLFTYGKGNTEVFNNDILHNNIPILTVDDYFQVIYNVYTLSEKLNYNNTAVIIEKLETYIPKQLKNQIGFVFENQIVYLRYQVIKWCIENKILSDYNNKIQFIILH